MRALFLAAAFTLTACGAPSPPPETSAPEQAAPAPVTAVALSGRWVVTAIDGALPVPGENTTSGLRPLSIVFSIYEPAIAEGPTHLGGYSGCNDYFAPFALQDGVLLTDSVGSTTKSCGDSPVGRQEDRMLGILFSDPTLSLDAAGALQITDANGGALTAVREGRPFPTMAGLEGRWRITAAGAQPLAPSLSEGAYPLLLFERDPEGPEVGPFVGGYTGCNSFGGAIRIEGGRLAAGQLIQTEIGCGGALGLQEDAVMGAMEVGAPVSILEDGSLLIGPPEAPLLRAVRIAP